MRNIVVYDIEVKQSIASANSKIERIKLIKTFFSDIICSH